MRFLSLYTPAVASQGPPDADHMAKMGQLMEKMMKAGVLETTGGILSRTTGMKIVRKNGSFTAADGPVAGSSLMPAAGYAIMRAETRQDLVRFIREFLEIAGDGACELIQIMDGAPASASAAPRT